MVDESDFVFCRIFPVTSTQRSNVKMNRESSQLSSLLTDTIRMLCQNGVEYNENLRIQGLLVVTADSNHVHVIEISDTFPSPQGTGVESTSGLCETEMSGGDMEYKPPAAYAPPPAQGFPVTQRRVGPSFHAGMRRGYHTVRPPVKRRGGFQAAHGSRGGHQKMAAGAKKPRVKMEDPTVILVDSPEDAAGDMIEPKVEAGWADPTGGYQNISEFSEVEAGDMLSYGGGTSEMQNLYSSSQSFQSSSGRHRGQRTDSTVSHTVTSSDEQLAQDIKPFQLTCDTAEQYEDEDSGQSFLQQVSVKAL